VNLAAVDKVDHDFFAEVQSIMEAEGFEFVADLFVYNESLKTYNRLFYNSAEDIRLEVREVFWLNEEQLKQGKKVEEKTSMIIFENVFSDGLKLTTSTSKLPSVYKYKDRIEHKYYALEPGEALKRHREHIIENSIGRQIINNNWVNAKETVLKEQNQEIDRQIKHGFIKLDSSGQYYYATLYGAVTLVAKLMLFKINNHTNKKKAI
jgi:hypothetical protein